MNLPKILAQHPMPWRRLVNGPGRPMGDVAILDANQQIVPLFTIVAFTELVTMAMAAAKAEQQESQPAGA